MVALPVKYVRGRKTAEKNVINTEMFEVHLSEVGTMVRLRVQQQYPCTTVFSSASSFAGLLLVDTEATPTIVPFLCLLFPCQLL